MTSPTDPAPEGARPLDGVKVLDLARVLSGPLCAAMLGDLGAEVIKVEHPRGGDDSRSFGPFIDGESNYFMMLNRGKRSVALDLKSDEGRAFVHALVAQVDVVVENFRPGVTERLGLDFATLREINPRLVYVSISGFGQEGPLAQRAAYDHIIQAMSGIMTVTGWPDGPPTRVGDAVADVLAGIYGAFGALAALRTRDRTGEAQHVDVAMLDAMFSLQLISAIELLGGDRPTRHGNAHPISAPMDAYAAADGEVVIAVANDSLFSRLATALERPDLIDDERFATDPARLRHQGPLREAIEAWTSRRTVDEVVDGLAAHGIPVAPVRDLGTALHAPEARERGVLSSAPHPAGGSIEVLQQPVRFSGWRNDPDTRAPRLGEHTAEVAAELGLAPAEAAR
jgi:CoA:oxalate CoA-transferase